jgi:hypothetical protein
VVNIFISNVAITLNSLFLCLISRQYLQLLLIVAEIGNENLFFHLLEEQYKKLSPNKYRVLIESLGKISNAAGPILFRLIATPAPGQLTKQIAVHNAYLAALYYEH